MQTNLYKRIITSLFFLVFFLGTTSFAQSEDFDFHGTSILINKKVVEHLGEEYVTFLKSNNPDLLLYLNYFSSNAYLITDIGEKSKESEIKNISSQKKLEKSNAVDFNSSNLESFNILAYGIQLTDQQQVFLTGNGSNAFVILSKETFWKKYNAYKKSLLK